jgi:hypothetical protein
MELCEHAADEQDPEKLATLILEINYFLETKERRLIDATLSNTPYAKAE